MQNMDVHDLVQQQETSIKREAVSQEDELGSSTQNLSDDRRCPASNQFLQASTVKAEDVITVRMDEDPRISRIRTLEKQLADAVKEISILKQTVSVSF